MQVATVLGKFYVYCNLQKELICNPNKKNVSLLGTVPELSSCCCLPTPLTLVSGGSPMIPLVVHQPAYPSIWPAAPSLRQGDNVMRMWVQLKRWCVWFQNLCKLCLPLLPPAMVARLPFLGKPAMQTRWMADNAPHKKRPMSRIIQVRPPHANKSGFAISATDKYKLGSRY